MGLLTAERIWLHPNGKWHRKEKEHWRPSPWSQRYAAPWIQESATDFSKVWYAARIGWVCRLFLEHIKIGNSAKPHVHALAYEIGVLKNDANWRLQHKPSVLTGGKQRRNLAKLREDQNARAKTHVIERRGLIETLMQETQRTGGALDNWLVQQLKERHSIQVSKRTVRGDRRAIRG